MDLPERTSHWTYGGNAAFHNYANDYSHITDPNLRRRLALSEIDKVPLGLYHIRAILVAGVGFFLDSYDIFAINVITIWLGLAFWQGPPHDARYGFGGNNGTLPTPVSQTLKASTSAGIIVGMVLFGWLADTVGRRKMYGIELIIIVVSTLLCALVSPSQSMNSTVLLTFWRVMMVIPWDVLQDFPSLEVSTGRYLIALWLITVDNGFGGIGIGGDYPLSAIITSEFAPTRWRGAMMAGVFSMQGMGQLLAAVVALIVTVAFKSSFIDIAKVSECGYACQIAADRCWRIVVGVGAIPACFALYYRITIPETPRYTFDVAHDVEQADANIRAFISSKSKGDVDIVRQARLKKLAGPSLTTPVASWRDLAIYFSQWKNVRVLAGTTLSWFFLDLAFYGLGLNNSLVLEAAGYGSNASLYTKLYNNAVGLIILSVAGSLPGYWTAIFTIDTFGRKTLQISGFLVLTIIFSVIGFAYDRLSSGALLALYILAQFFFDLGPNTTTFIIPGECFPTRYRATGHGLSAAAGKTGAIVAQVVSIPMLSNCTGTDCSARLGSLMRLFALFMLLGTLASLLVPETKGFTLEELAGEQPTSYNAGRNGSITGVASAAAVPRRLRLLNLFSGGKPAGFAYPRTGGGMTGAWRTGDGDMKAGAPAAARGKGWWRWRQQRRRYGSGDGPTANASVDLRPWSSSSSMRMLDHSPDLARPGTAVPGWNAGWGRIDRGASPDDIRLQDVGGLIK